jgi:hypothetical protein
MFERFTEGARWSWWKPKTVADLSSAVLTQLSVTA